MDYSDLFETAKKAVLTPKYHKYSALFILDCHEMVYHRRKERDTLAELCSRFWIIQGRLYIKKSIDPCIISES